MIDQGNPGVGPDGDEPLDEFAQSLILLGKKPRTFSSPEASWAAFSSRMSVLAASVEPVSAVRALPQQKAAPDPLAVGSLAPGVGESSGVVSMQALKVFAFGTIFGGAVIGGLWMHERGKQSASAQALVETHSIAPSQSRAPVQSAAQRVHDMKGHDHSAGSGRPLTQSTGSATHVATDSDSAEEPANVLSRSAFSTNQGSRQHQTQSAQASSLAEQTQLLEEARHGDPVRALELIYAFHKTYPRSPLRADAEVVALGALRALGKTEAFKKRAEIYLKRYPKDPHTLRVKNWLSE